ncbi:MAG: YraN family protein [Symploca sp. SIO2G7]|nr:YraN family protein [Symploca sp. SIO2G7]
MCHATTTYHLPPTTCHLPPTTYHLPPVNFKHYSSTTPNQQLEIGKLGEQLVAQWLKAQNWLILAYRWRCRWGEIDLIAQRGASKQLMLAFVEVKTRSWRNWDDNGLLAITPQKQAKLWQTAELFLSENPEMADFSCRFDVALVSCEHLSPTSNSSAVDDLLQVSSVQLGKPVFVTNYKLILRDYIPSAFD